MAKKQVALVLCGGASLGAYIAGAIDEVLLAFRHSDQFEIDIITGASAGALTGALTAFGLRYQDGQPPLYDSWVRKVDATQLLAPDIAPGEPFSIFNPRRLHEATLEVIQWADPADPGRRAAFCADTLRVGMTITNLTPLPYISRVPQPASGREEPFIQYRTAEQQNYRLGPGTAPTDPLWQAMTENVRASAAAPFAFPPVRLPRDVGAPDDDAQYIMKPQFTGPANFWYVDGAVHNNLPVDLAWHFTRQTGHAPEDRVFVVVNPFRSDARAIDPAPAAPSLLHYVQQLLGAVTTESSAVKFQQEVVLPAQQAA
ncbi:MAG TPA: patatin-like phospholipase family protein, partial [Chloroflexia bacterium]|nr:patatin-like phospholipase family protein [Chloroflexia bacterium]